MSMTEKKLKQRQARAKRYAYVPPSVKEGLEQGKHYSNYSRNQATRRSNPNARRIKSGQVVSTWAKEE